VPEAGTDPLGIGITYALLGHPAEDAEPTALEFSDHGTPTR
jgi:hypothetical protein